MNTTTDTENLLIRKEDGEVIIVLKANILALSLLVIVKADKTCVH